MRSILPLFAVVFAAAAPALASETIPLPPFHSVQLRGGGEVIVVPGPVERVTLVDGSTQFTQFRVERHGQLRIDTCNDRCPHLYHMTLRIESPMVPDLAVAGGGTIVVQNGFAPQGQLSTAIDGGGRIDARAIEAASVSAAVNGGGAMLVRPRETLAAAVSGGGSIHYWGHPQLQTAIQGGGSVSPAG